MKQNALSDVSLINFCQGSYVYVIYESIIWNL